MSTDDRNAEAIREIATRNGFDEGAGTAMASALAAGNGTLAQFDHPGLGGMGQWSQGGMLMIGDMFNDGLKARVGTLASELSRAMGDGRIARTPPAERKGMAASSSHASGRWWPEEFGAPSSSGGQNGDLYAVFPDQRRLAIRHGGKVTVYDTGNHAILGASQQQGSNSVLTFATARGAVALDDLDRIGEDDKPRPRQDPGSQTSQTASQDGRTDSGGKSDDVAGKIRQLAALRDEGHLSEEEFATRKAGLLDRL